MKRNSLNAESLNLWECCGNLYSAGVAKCSKCHKSRFDNRSEQCPHPERECNESPALELPASFAPLLEGFTGRVTVWIERHSPRELDDDNFIAGCKELRDAIAEILGRKGDSESDGITFKYSQQKKSCQKVIISVYADNILS
ncbi:MAG: hypothetical protein WCI51_07205 [Lentisphaerota bacterium]